MDKDWWVVVLSGIGAIFALVFIGFVVIVGEHRAVNSNKHVFIQENSLGCRKYRYNESYYWKCPKELDINSIEETKNSGRSTSTVQVPVIQE